MTAMGQSIKSTNHSEDTLPVSKTSGLFTARILLGRNRMPCSPFWIDRNHTVTCNHTGTELIPFKATLLKKQKLPLPTAPLMPFADVTQSMLHGFEKNSNQIFGVVNPVLVCLEHCPQPWEQPHF